MAGFNDTFKVLNPLNFEGVTLNNPFTKKAVADVTIPVKALVIGGEVALAAGFGLFTAVGAEVISGFSKLGLAGKSVAVLGGVAATGAVLSNPVGALKSVGSIPQAAFDLGTTVANPSAATGLNFVKEHPVTTAVGAAATLYAVKGAIPSILTALNTNAVKQNTAVTNSQAPVAAVPSNPLINSMTKTPATSTHKKKKKKAPKKKKRKSTKYKKKKAKR